MFQLKFIIMQLCIKFKCLYTFEVGRAEFTKQFIAVSVYSYMCLYEGWSDLARE
jgi:hypothetical protein